MKNVVYAIIYLTLIQPSTSSSEVEQEFKTEYQKKVECYPYPSMCKVDPHDCLMNRGGGYAEEMMRGIHINHPEVYKRFRNRTFGISVPDCKTDECQKSNVYSIYRFREKYLNAGRRDVAAERVQGCCDINFQQTCILPDHEENTALALVIRKAKSMEDDVWYSMILITEKASLFCESDEDADCYYIDRKNGSLMFKYEFSPLSLDEVVGYLKPDYCFFHASNDLASRIPKDNITITKIDENGRTDCIEVLNSKHNSVFDIVRNHADIILEGVICFRMRVMNQPDWLPSVGCFHLETSVAKSDTSSYLAATVISIVVFVMILLIIGCYKRILMDRKFEKSVPKSLVIAKTDYRDEFKSSVNTASKSDQYPEEIFFCVGDESVNVDKTCPDANDALVHENCAEDITEDRGYREKILTDAEAEGVYCEKIGLAQADGEYSVKFDHQVDADGVYCNKFNLISYVRVKNEIEKPS